MKMNKESNTVILDLYRYEQLSSIERNLKEGKIAVTKYVDRYGKYTNFHTLDETVISLNEINRGLVDSIALLEVSAKDVDNQKRYREIAEDELKRVKGLSWLQLWKWYKNNE